MYDFVDHHSHDYLFSSQRDQRAPDVDFNPAGTALDRERERSRRPGPRVYASKAPTGRLTDFDPTELTGGWEVAQAADTVHSVFQEMFAAEGIQDLHMISKAAADWQATVAGKADTGQMAPDGHRAMRQALQGVIDSCTEALRLGQARWWPGKRGVSLTADEAPEDLGAWYRATERATGERYRVRKHGEMVEVETLDRYSNTRERVSRTQARGRFELAGKEAELAEAGEQVA